ENIRFRDRAIGFDTRPPRADWKAETLVTFGELTKGFDDFQLTVHPGRLRKGEVVGVVGPNATGKTTFVKLIASTETPTARAGGWRRRRLSAASWRRRPAPGSSWTTMCLSSTWSRTASWSSPEIRAALASVKVRSRCGTG